MANVDERVPLSFDTAARPDEMGDLLAKPRSVFRPTKIRPIEDGEHPPHGSGRFPEMGE